MRERSLTEAREMIEASVAEGRVDLNHFIKVRDASGNIVPRLRFREAITILSEVPT